MKRRSKVGGAAVKWRRHTPKSVRGRSSVAAGPKEEVARLVGKRDEALEQLFASASLATTAAAALALTSAASAFPDKLLQFVTPYPFGGSHVLHASIITTAAEPHF